MPYVLELFHKYKSEIDIDALKKICDKDTRNLKINKKREGFF